MQTRSTAPNGIRVQRFSMLEMIVYIVTLSTISLFLVKFFHSSTKLNRQAVSRSHRYQSVERVHREWKVFIAETVADDWNVKGENFEAGEYLLKPQAVQVPIYEKKPKKKPSKPSSSAFDFFGSNEIEEAEEESEPTPPPEPPKLLGYEARRTGTLEISLAGKPTGVIRLPKDATATFTVEVDGDTPFAIMTLVFPDSPYFRQETIRLVASAGREEEKQ